MVSANAAGVLKQSMNDSLACIYTHMQLAMEEMHVVDWKIEMFGLLTKSNCPIPARLVWYQYYHVDT